MRGVFALVLLAGVGLAGGAAKLVMDHVNTLTQQRDIAISRALPTVPMAEVIVATEALRSGQALLQNHVQVVPWPQANVLEGTYVSLDDVFPEGATGPRIVLQAFVPGEPLLKAKVSQPGAPAGLAFQLDPGQRAFALRVDVSSGVSGFLRPGDRVDIYWTGTPPGSSRGEITKLIKSSVRLLATDQSRDTDREVAVVARTVTVSITPQDVADLAQAQNSGRLTLSLVGAADENSVISAIEVDQQELLGIEKIEVQEVEQQKVCTVRNRRGAEVIITEIPCTN